MRNQHRFLVAASMSALLLSACKKDEAEPVDLGYDYFPTKVGSWVEYQVDSLWRDDAASPAVLDSVSYRLLERIEENYTDPEGRPSQRVLRYVRDVDDNWVVRDVWTRTFTTTAGEMTEENKRRLKLSFPVRSSRTWNINVYNTDPELTVAFRDVDSPWQAGGLSFEKTVLVKNTVPPNYIDKKNFEERYARGVGMVSKYWEVTNTQYPPPPAPPTPEVVGWRLNMVVVAFGNE
ncbi:MAG: hypothetical protein ABI432_16540 [Flavobacteriales bacterium]